MIKVRHDSVLEINGLIPSVDLSEKEIKLLNEFEKVRFSVLDYSNTAFHFLLREILSNLQDSYKIYLVYIESKAQSKSSVRSFKKMFHAQKKQSVFSESDIYEKEVDMAEGKSILISTIKLSKTNKEYVLDHLLTTNFRFGYLVRKGKKSFSKNLPTFLENVVALLSDKSSISRLNYIELLLSEVKKNKHIFRIPYAVNNKDYLEFLIRKEDKELSEKLIEVEMKYRTLIEN